MKGDPVREKLQRLWSEHLNRPFPSSQWGELEDRFGWSAEKPEIRNVADADRLQSSWGDPDLVLYDTYVAGHVSTILTGHRGGKEVLADVRPDTRLQRYFEVCLREAPNEATRETVKACRNYFDKLNKMLDVARRVPRS
jgi:hypothetical protein